MNEALWDDHRVTRFDYTVLSRDGRVLGALPGVRGGKLIYSVDARIKSAGQLQVVSKEPPEWWGTKLIQIHAQVNDFRWSLGVFVPSTPKQEYHSEGVEYTIELHDKLLFLDQDVIPQASSIPVGSFLRDVVIDLIKSIGETQVNIGEFVAKPRPDGGHYTDGTNKRPLVWDAGTPKLTIVNDILDYIGYFSLFADGSGQFTSHLYHRPMNRPVLWSLHEGDKSIHSVDWTYQQDLANIPNRIVYTTQDAISPDGSEVPVLTSVAENLDPESPYSFQARGRWISEVRTDVEALSQAELDDMTVRRLKRSMTPMVKVEISNALMPFELNQLVNFKSRGREMDMSVRRMEVVLSPEELMYTTLRRVNR